MSVTINSQLNNGFFGENSFVITDDKTGETAIVDPCFENFRAVNLPEKIKYILLTHGHVDHIAHVEAVKNKCGGEIVAHKSEKNILENPNLNLTSSLGPDMSIIADILVEDGDSLSLGESEIKIFHTPGHTSGSCCYIIGNHMFTGDTIISMTIGRCDLPTGDYEVMKKSIQKIKALSENYNIYCGHGDNSTLDNEAKYNPYFR